MHNITTFPPVGIAVLSMKKCSIVFIISAYISINFTPYDLIFSLPTLQLLTFAWTKYCVPASQS